MDDVESAKRRAATAAAETVDDGQVVGLGSGSTAAHAIRALGTRVDAGLDVVGVPTSLQAREVARAAAVPLREPEDVDRIDVAIDGADQVAGATLLKGGGGAHAREKLIDAAAEELVIVVDERKLVSVIDDPVPLDVLPAARSIVASRIRDLGGDPELRQATAKSGPVVTDNGTLLLDCDFGSIDEPGRLASALDAVPGILEHGLFVELADAVYVGDEDGVRVR